MSQKPAMKLIKSIVTMCVLALAVIRDSHLREINMVEQELQPPVGRRNFWDQFPWWFFAAIVLLAVSLYVIVTNPDFNEVLQFITEGLSFSLIITFASAVPALLVGFLIAIGCRSKHVLLRNLAFFYLAIVGGIPTIVMIFFISFAVIPFLISWLGAEEESLSHIVRGIIALSLVYSAIYGDVFRLGFFTASNDRTQNHFGRLGSKTLIAVGITFIAMLKDSSLLSILAIREIAQLTRLFAGGTFRFTETYLIAIFLYLLLTIPIRFLIQQYEQRLNS